ncbi:MAG: hypothetical protein Tsb006_2890 [Rickettsiaceae bacterium]
MNKIKGFIIYLAITLFIGVAVAAEQEKENEPKAKLRDPAEFQKVVDDYKAYVAKIPPEIRDEIIEYRKEVAKINKQKRLLYRKLSQASQNYLKKEQQYKKKLPLNRKNLISMPDDGPKEPEEQKNKDEGNK